METNDKKRRLPEDNVEPVQEPVSIQEQMARRQSAPQPTAVGELDRIRQAQMMQRTDGAMDGFRALSQVIGKEQIQDARQTLMRYKEGKANQEQKDIECEQWY